MNDLLPLLLMYELGLLVGGLVGYFEAGKRKAQREQSWSYYSGPAPR